MAPLPHAAATGSTKDGQPGDRFVTLVTGDRVAVRDGRAISVQRGPGREHIRFLTENHDGRSYVLPEDALRPVAAGQVDRRLFDVAELVESGYDDAHRDTTPVLVTRPSGMRAARQIEGTDLTAAQAPKTTGAWQSLLQSGKVWLDGKRHLALDQSTKQIGAPAAWQAGFTGTGVKVAVLDTGVDEKHPDLAGKQIAEKNFTFDPDNTDNVGHGTHVASTIASGDTTFRGVAPDVRILDGKVCMDRDCPESSILAGMQWAAEQGADVVNMSLGSRDTPGDDVLEDALNRLSAEHGTLFVVSAGNSGPGQETVGSPSTADAALSVGAVDRDESLAPFSSRGPRKGDGALKPEVTAPGVGIVAAKAGTSDRIAMSGTSMAAPHVTGAAALLKQQHHDWTGAQIKAQLVATAKPNGTNTAYEQGAGRIDLTKAITQAVTADPATVSLGSHDWPHGDDRPVTKEITYRNPGAAEVTLDLSLDAKAPAGMFSLSPAKLTIPAGGTAKAAVTGDSRVGTEDGPFSGSVVATGGGSSTRTPIGLVRAIEAYNLTIKVTDRAGNPDSTHWTKITGTDNSTFFSVPQDPSGTSVVRVPKGRYLVDSQLFAAAPSTAVDVMSAGVNVTKDTTIELDARRTKPVEITGPAATQTHAELLQAVTTPAGGTSSSVWARSFDDVRIAGLGDRLPGYQAGFSSGWDTADGGRHEYAFEERDILPTGFSRTVREQDLAHVDVKLGPVPEGRRASFTVSPVFSNGSAAYPWYLATPAASTVKYAVNAEKGVTWVRSFYQVNGTEFPPELYLSSPAKPYTAGKSYTERTNLAVFGPALSSDFDITRRSDGLGVSVSLLSDEAGGRGDATKYESAATRLYRNGTLVGATPYPGNGLFPKLPAGTATYRVESEVARSSSDVSTKVSGSWTFRTDVAVGALYRPMPISAVRFEPVLSDTNSAPAGKLLQVPLNVQQSKSDENGRIQRVEVEVSFDDGRTWQQVPVLGRTALVRNPATGFASLRAKASDSKGNCSEVTIIRAYKIG